MRENTKDVQGLQPTVTSEIHTCAHKDSSGQQKGRADGLRFKSQVLPSCVTLDKMFSLLSVTSLMCKITFFAWPLACAGGISSSGPGRWNSGARALPTRHTGVVPVNDQKFGLTWRWPWGGTGTAHALGLRIALSLISRGQWLLFPKIHFSNL